MAEEGTVRSWIESGAVCWLGGGSGAPAPIASGCFAGPLSHPIRHMFPSSFRLIRRFDSVCCPILGGQDYQTSLQAQALVCSQAMAGRLTLKLSTGLKFVPARKA